MVNFGQKYAIMRITFALRVRVLTFVSLSRAGTLICDVKELKVHLKCQVIQLQSGSNNLNKQFCHSQLHLRVLQMVVIKLLIILTMLIFSFALTLL